MRYKEVDAGFEYSLKYCHFQHVTQNIVLYENPKIKLAQRYYTVPLSCRKIRALMNYT